MWVYTRGQTQVEWSLINVSVLGGSVSELLMCCYHNPPSLLLQDEFDDLIINGHRVL